MARAIYGHWREHQGREYELLSGEGSTGEFSQEVLQLGAPPKLLNGHHNAAAAMHKSHQPEAENTAETARDGAQSPLH